MGNIKLKEARNGSDVKQICEKVGISESAYRKYEMGVRVPRDEIKRKLANHFGMTVQELFFYN